MTFLLGSDHVQAGLCGGANDIDYDPSTMDLLSAGGFLLLACLDGLNDSHNLPQGW